MSRLASRAGAIGVLAGLAVTVTPTVLPAQRTVPLPSGVTVIRPGPTTPKELAAFSGKWFGRWGTPGTPEGSREIILAFERIETDPPRATVVYAWGPRSENAKVPGRSHTTGPGWRRLKGTFVGGAFHLSLDDTVRVFRLGPGDTLNATWTQGQLTDRATLHRMPK
jgi:hypothetical protein